jgi:hypothetical protein
VSQRFPYREKRQAQPEDEEGQAGYDQQSADKQGNEAIDGLPDHENLENTDNDNDRQQVTHAGNGIVEKYC